MKPGPAAVRTEPAAAGTMSKPVRTQKKGPELAFGAFSPDGYSGGKGGSRPTETERTGHQRGPRRLVPGLVAITETFFTGSSSVVTATRFGSSIQVRGEAKPRRLCHEHSDDSMPLDGHGCLYRDRDGTGRFPPAPAHNGEDALPGMRAGTCLADVVSVVGGDAAPAERTFSWRRSGLIALPIRLAPSTIPRALRRATKLQQTDFLE